MIRGLDECNDRTTEYNPKHTIRPNWTDSPHFQVIIMTLLTANQSIHTIIPKG